MTAQTTETTETIRAKWLDLSLTQLIGGSAAAATAAALGSRLGVAGTVLGAAVASLVSATAAGVYTGSLHRARSAIAANRSAATSDQPRPRRWRLDRRGVRRVLAMTGVLFALAAAFLIALQLTSGANVTGTTIGTRSAVVEQPAPAPQDGADSPIVPPTTDSGIPATPSPDATTSATDAPAVPFSATPPAPTDTAPAQTPTDLPATPAPAQGTPTDAAPAAGAQAGAAQPLPSSPVPTP